MLIFGMQVIEVTNNACGPGVLFRRAPSVAYPGHWTAVGGLFSHLSGSRSLCRHSVRGGIPFFFVFFLYFKALSAVASTGIGRYRLLESLQCPCPASVSSCNKFLEMCYVPVTSLRFAFGEKIVSVTWIP